MVEMSMNSVNVSSSRMDCLRWVLAEVGRVWRVARVVSEAGERCCVEGGVDLTGEVGYGDDGLPGAISAVSMFALVLVLVLVLVLESSNNRCISYNPTIRSNAWIL